MRFCRGAMPNAFIGRRRPCTDRRDWAEHAIVITPGCGPARLSSIGMRVPQALPAGMGTKGRSKANAARTDGRFFKKQAPHELIHATQGADAGWEKKRGDRAGYPASGHQIMSDE